MKLTLSLYATQDEGKLLRFCVNEDEVIYWCVGSCCGLREKLEADGMTAGSVIRNHLINLAMRGVIWNEMDFHERARRVALSLEQDTRARTEFLKAAILLGKAIDDEESFHFEMDLNDAVVLSET